MGRLSIALKRRNRAFDGAQVFLDVEVHALLPAWLAGLLNAKSFFSGQPVNIQMAFPGLPGSNEPIVRHAVAVADAGPWRESVAPCAGWPSCRGLERLMR